MSLDLSSHCSQEVTINKHNLFALIFLRQHGFISLFLHLPWLFRSFFSVAKSFDASLSKKAIVSPKQ